MGPSKLYEHAKTREDGCQPGFAVGWETGASSRTVASGFRKRVKGAFAGRTAPDDEEEVCCQEGFVTGGGKDTMSDKPFLAKAADQTQRCGLHLALGDLGVVGAVLGTKGAGLDAVDGLEGEDGQDGAAVELLQQVGDGEVPGDGGDDEAPDAGKLHQGVVGLAAGQEEEQQGEREEEGGEHQVGGEGAEPEEEGVDAPQAEHHLLALDGGQVHAGLDQGAVEGHRHPEGAVGGEGDRGKAVLAGVLQDAGDELGQAAEEEAERVDEARAVAIRQGTVDALQQRGGQAEGEQTEGTC